MKYLKANEVFPGSEVSVNHFVCNPPGCLLYTYGEECPGAKYQGGSIFVGHVTGYIQVELQSKLNTRPFVENPHEHTLVPLPHDFFKVTQDLLLTLTNYCVSTRRWSCSLHPIIVCFAAILFGASLFVCLIFEMTIKIYKYCLSCIRKYFYMSSLLCNDSTDKSDTDPSLTACSIARILSLADFLDLDLLGS